MSIENNPTVLPAGAGELTSDKGYKWIAREIERLDPEVDYARIWALSTTYYADDTLVNLLYALGMPCFTQSPHGSELLMNRSHKARNRKQDRANDTLAHFWRWFEYGPEHIEAQRSIEQVNRIHEAMAKMVAEAFTNDDFIYTTSWLGTKLHRMRLLMGLPGFSEKQKVAAHHFWQGVMLKMRGPHGYVHSYPESFEEMEAFVDRTEARKWPQTESGKELAEYVIDQFNEARLPKPLWGIGRQLILTFQTKAVRDLHRMGDPNPIASWLIKLALKTKIRLQEQILPDPKMNTAERARTRGDIQDQHREPPMVAPSACPFHVAHRAVRARIGR